MAQRNTKTPRLHQLMIRTDSRDRPKQAAVPNERRTKRQKAQPKAQLYDYSTLLFSQPSFLRGMARLFDITGSLSSRLDELTPAQIDAAALYADFYAVLRDHQTARQQLVQQGLWEDVVA